MKQFENFLEIVKLYSEIYKKFEDFQNDKENFFIPKKGDQKTGVIGESFVFEYLNRTKQKDLHFGSHSEKGWDIESKDYKYQIKTVSAFSKTGILSPIHNGWDFLYLIKLNTSFLPCKVLKIENPRNWNKNIIKGKRYPSDGSKTFEICGKECIIIDETNMFLNVLDIRNT